MAGTTRKINDEIKIHIGLKGRNFNVQIHTHRVIFCIREHKSAVVSLSLNFYHVFIKPQKVILKLGRKLQWSA